MDKKIKSFSLIELIIAISLLIVGVFATYTLGGSISANINLQKNKTIALNLCEEGLEVIRNKRDTNWQQGRVNWLSGMFVRDEEDFPPYCDECLDNCSQACNETPYKIEIDYLGNIKPFRREVAINKEYGEILKLNNQEPYYYLYYSTKEDDQCSESMPADLIGSSCKSTQFKRRITLVPIIKNNNIEYLEVKCEVFWKGGMPIQWSIDEAEGNFSETMFLYNWL